MRVTIQPTHHEYSQRVEHFMKQLSALAVLFFVGCGIVVAFGAAQASGDVGDLGPPPGELEIKQTLADFYNAGQPLGTTVDVQFDGPILMGPPTEHAIPPPRPWCVRCGYPYPGTSLMYPVTAVVTVTVTHGLGSSALSPSNSVGITTTYNGTPCAAESKTQYCPAYYFHRDDQGNWQVA